MKRKLLFIFGVIGVLALLIGFIKDLESTEILAKEQPISESVLIGQADIDNGDQIRVDNSRRTKYGRELNGFIRVCVARKWTGLLF